MDRNIPIQCILSDDEMNRRREDFRAGLFRAVIGVDEMENGFRYRLRAQDPVLRDLVEFMILERKCCPFLDFSLTVKAGSEVAEMELAGSAGAKGSINELFNQQFAEAVQRL